MMCQVACNAFACAFTQVLDGGLGSPPTPEGIVLDFDEQDLATWLHSMDQVPKPDQFYKKLVKVSFAATRFEGPSTLRCIRCLLRTMCMQVRISRASMQRHVISHVSAKKS